MDRRAGAIAAVSAAVIVLAAAVYVIVQKPSVPHAGQTPGYGAGSPVGAASSAGAPGSPQPAASTVVAFLGDDYTAGTGASDPSKGFTRLVAASLGVRGAYFGDPGGGYAKAGTSGKTYLDQVGAVVAAHPAMVVVTGGRNDYSDYQPTMATDARSLFAALHNGLPRAKLVAVAPFWGDSSQPAVLAKIGAAVRTAVRAVGGTYVNLADPLRGHPDFMASSADPNNAGYIAIAAALTPKLRALLPAPS